MTHATDFKRPIDALNAKNAMSWRDRWFKNGGSPAHATQFICARDCEDLRDLRERLMFHRLRLSRIRAYRFLWTLSVQKRLRRARRQVPAFLLTHEAC